MKKTQLIIACLLIYGFSKSQVNIDQALMGGNNYNITAPSPESFYKANFGNIAINEFKGEPIVNIPLSTFTVNQIPFDLNFKYLKAGVKVNDFSNSTGMNWVLDTGGMITRTINDVPDESRVRSLYSTLPDITSNPQYWGAYVKQEYYDHEIDIFNFSISGYSGSFYLGDDLQPIIITKDNNCKIETVGDFKINHSFKIIDNNGVEYLFGGNGFTEQTISRENSAGTGITGFYLAQITDRKTGNIVNYQYDILNSRQITTGISESYNSKTPFIQDICQSNPQPATGIQQQVIILKVLDPKRLKKITSDDYRIDFNYIDDIHLFYTKLNNISIYNKNNLIRKYELSYLDHYINNTLQRFFLTGIKNFEINSNIETFKQQYSLEYNNPLLLPERLSNSQDYLGYFNGRLNLNLAPNINYFLDTDDQAYYNYADRRPDFQYAQYGTLKSITYPTKGKSYFEYESIPKKAENFETANLSIGVSNPASSFILSPTQYTSNKFQIEFLIQSSSLSNSEWKMKSEFQILDDLNVIVHREVLNIPKGNSGYTTVINYNLEPNKTYKFLMKINDNTCVSCTGTAAITYSKGWKAVDNIGIRLKKTFDLTGNDTVNIKRIYYTDFNNLNNIDKTTHDLIPEFRTHFDLVRHTAPPNWDQCTLNSTNSPYPGTYTLVENVSSTPLISSLEESQVALYEDDVERNFSIYDPMYTDVTISYGGDNFEKGGEEKKFYVKNKRNLSPELYIPNFSSIPSGDFMGNENVFEYLKATAKNKLYKSISFSNIEGKQLLNKIFEFKNGSPIYKRIAENNYTFNSTVGKYNITGADIFLSSINLYALYNKYVVAQPLFTSEALLNETIVKDYPDPSSEILTTNEYYYTNPTKQLTKQTITSSDNVITNTTYSYAHEKGNQLMISKNMIGIPLETTTTQTIGGVTKTLGKSETIYPMSVPTSQTGNLVLPLSQKSYDRLDNSVSTDVTYDKYDDKGNILQYTTKDGIPVSIIWGYNKTQPIAKIEGITYDQLTSVVSVSGIVLASDNDALDPTTEGSILNALNNFRKESALIGKKITTYTYDPLIGVTSITPPSGVRQSYQYDSANRLKEGDIRGKNSAGSYINKKVSENNYNYKP